MVATRLLRSFDPILSLLCLLASFAAMAQGVPAARTTVDGPQQDSWGVGCSGVWSAWTACTQQCWTERKLTLHESWGCPESVQDDEVQFAICDTDSCPMQGDGDGFLMGIHAPLFQDRINSGQTAALGDAIRLTQVFMQLLLISSLAGLALVHHLKLRWLPDMCVVIPVAAAFAMFARFHTFHGVAFGPAANAVVGTFVSTIMNTVLLPVSIFEGAFHLQRLNFFSQFGYGVLFSVVGTCLSCAMIAAMVKYSGDAGWHPVTSWREAVAYGAFIADTDPVATLSVFSSLKVDALLSTLVAAESTMNDPVALVIFNLCNQHTLDLSISFGDQVLGACWLLGGSIATGAGMGALLLATLRCFRLRGKGPLEAVYFVSCAFTAFCMGEALSMSGIIVTLFCGMVMGVYAPTLVEDAAAVSNLLSCMARLADIIIFILIGFSTFLIDEMAGVQLGFLTIVFCIVSRAIMVVCLVLFTNAVKLLRGYDAIGFGTAFMICHSGFRGGMTMMMALMLDPFWATNQNTMVIGTIISVIGMAYLSGCTGPFFLRIMRIPMDVPQEDGELYRASSVPSNLLNRVHGTFGKLLLWGHSVSNRGGESQADASVTSVAPAPPRACAQVVEEP